MVKPLRSRSFCFTIANPEDDLDLVNNDDIIYAVWQMEICPDTGTPHYQGYFYTQNKKNIFQAKEYLCNKAHIEIARGSPKENFDYCTKSDSRMEGTDYFETGILPQKGKRNDLESLYRKLNEGGFTQQKYAIEYFPLFVRYPNVIKNWYEATVEERREEDGFKTIFFYGPPRTGKSKLAHHLARQHTGGFYRFCLREYWDGYIGQRAVLFDDFRGCALSFGHFKQVIDEYPFRVNIKHVSSQLAANNFYITSNFLPHQWYDQQVLGADGVEAITGRIHEVYYFPEKGKFLHYHSYSDFAIQHLHGSLSYELLALRPQVQEFTLNEKKQVQEIRPYVQEEDV